jgi:succinoglycan biosynthesis protein ExoM
MMGQSTPIVIGIPTYRRPRQLGMLLESLVAELQGHDALVIVSDNECGTDVPRLLQSFEGRLPSVLSVQTPQRGIAANRNALVDAAYGHAPQWRQLIMLDDDGQVRPGWFAALTAVAAQTSADVTGSAVEFPLPERVGIFAANSEFARPRRWPTGPVPMLVGAQGVCFARRIEALVTRPWFNLDYGFSGGEDFEFFLRLKKAGASFAWADEALVCEPTPLERTSTRVVLHRSFTAGITNARAEIEHEGLLACTSTTFGHLVRTTAALLVHTALLRKDKAVRSVIAGAYTLGRLPGMSALVRKRYEGATRT